MARQVFNNLTVRLRADDESPLPDGLLEKSIFLQLAFSLELDRTVLPAAPHMRKGKSLGELWHDIEPENGRFRFEVGTFLPHYLPHFESEPDYSVEVGDGTLLVSTRMVRCFFADEDPNTQLKYWLVHRLGVPSLVEQRNLKHIHPVPIRTFVAKSFSVEALSAESAIQQDFLGWTDDLAADVSQLVEAVRTISPVENRHLLPVLAASAFPMFIVAATGANDKTGVEQFALHADQTAFRSLAALKGDDLAAARKLLKSGQPTPVEDSALGLARSFLHHGYRDLAILHICIACESVLARKYRDYLLSRGVSKSKYEQADRDISYSQLLNLHFATMCDLSTLADRD